MSYAAAMGPTFSKQRQSVAFGTVISLLIPPSGGSAINKGRKTKVTHLQYLAGGTAHTITAMRPLARTTVATAALAAATSLVITRDPGNYSANAVLDGAAVPSTANNLIAANDHIVIEKPDGTYLLTLPSAATTDSATGRVTLTVTALPTGGISAGAKVWFLGILADVDPHTGEAHPTFLSGTGLTTWPAVASQLGSLVETLGKDEPIVLQSNNATATGAFDVVSGVYADA